MRSLPVGVLREADHVACGIGEQRAWGIDDSRARIAMSKLHGDPVSAGRIERTALALGMSRSHFSRWFRASVGLTPGQYARLRRLEDARAELTNGAKPADVAASVGFADQAHLTRWFRSVFGVTAARVERVGPASTGETTKGAGQ